MRITNAMKLLYLTILVGSVLVSTVAADNSAGATLSASLCSIVADIRTVIGILALVLFIIGGTMYAAAHLLPAAGNLRGNLQGWSMGMIVGGIVGLILVLIAPTLLNVIISIGGSNSISASGC